MTLPTNQISAGIQKMSDLSDLGMDMNIFELNFWYQAQFCALLAAIFSKPDVIFILFDMELASKNKEMWSIDIIKDPSGIVWPHSPSLDIYSCITHLI